MTYDQLGGDALSIEAMLAKVAGLVDQLSRLPRVPTPDWFDRATGSLASLLPSGQACLILLDPLPTGRVGTIHATGTATFQGGMPKVGVEDMRVRLARLEGTDFMLGLSRAERSQALSTDAPNIIHGLATRAEGDRARAWWADLFPPAPCEGPTGEPQAGQAHNGQPQADPGKAHAPEVHPACQPTLLSWAIAPLSIAFPSTKLFVGILPEPQIQHAILGDQHTAMLRTYAGALAKLANAAMVTPGAFQTGSSVLSVQWLTPREQDVLELLLEGKSVREISEDLERSPHTVHDYVKNLHRKLGATSRGELVARVLGHAPGSPPHEA